MITSGAVVAQHAGMRWLPLVFLIACAADKPKPDLSAPYGCGSNTCGSGQVCVTEETGSQCGVNLDAGIGPYSILSQTCVTLPTSCDGTPTCDCVLGANQPFCNAEGRDVTWGCI